MDERANADSIPVGESSADDNGHERDSLVSGDRRLFPYSRCLERKCFLGRCFSSTDTTCCRSRPRTYYTPLTNRHADILIVSCRSSHGCRIEATRGLGKRSALSQDEAANEHSGTHTRACHCILIWFEARFFTECPYCLIHLLADRYIRIIRMRAD